MKLPRLDRAALRDRRNWAFLLGLVPFALLAAREWGYQLDINPADHHQYIAHAEALLDGRPYTDTGYIFSEPQRLFAPRAYPPGLPIMLAGAFAIFGASHAVAKAVTLACGFAFLLIAGLYFRRVAGWALGLGVVLTLGLSPKVLELSVGVMSDLPFAALVWLTLLLADGDGEMSWKRAFGLTAAAGFAVLVRPHGLVMLPAIAVWGLLNYRSRSRNVFIPALALLAATVVGRLVVGPESLRAFPPLSVLWEQVTSGEFRYGLAILESHLYPFPNDFANDVLHVFSLGLMLVGLAHFIWKQPRYLAVGFGLLYGLALAMVPGSTIRFSFPLYPLWVFGVFNGIRVCVRPLLGERSGNAALAVALAMSLFATGKGLTRDRFPPRYQEPPFAELMEFVEARVEAGDDLRVAFFRPRWITGQYGPPGMPLLTSLDTEVHRREWCRARLTHLILGGWAYSRNATPRTRAAMEESPDAFTLRFQNDVYEVYEIDPEILGCPQGAS